MVKHSFDYGVESANQEDRRISGFVLTSAFVITSLSIAAFLHMDSHDSESPIPTTPVSENVEKSE
jgi:hypothetical protein